MVDPHDIAEIVAAALVDGGHEGRTYRLSGPEALTPVDQVALLAEALDRPLTCDPIPDEETVAQAGPDYGPALVQIFRGHPSSRPTSSRPCPICWAGRRDHSRPGSPPTGRALSGRGDWTIPAP